MLGRAGRLSPFKTSHSLSPCSMREDVQGPAEGDPSVTSHIVSRDVMLDHVTYLRWYTDGGRADEDSQCRAASRER